MNETMRRLAGFIVALFLFAPFSLGLAIAQSARPEWQAEWDKTLEAAKKERKVVVSIPASAELRLRLEEVFEKKYPSIDLELVPSRGSSVINKILEERKAGIHYFDLHIGGTSSIVTSLLGEGILEPVQPWMILPEVKDPKNWWGGHMWGDKARQHLYIFLGYLTETLWYNANAFKQAEITSYDNLLNPKWKGKIALLDPRTPGSGENTWSFMWRIKGEEYLKKLVAQELIVGRNQRQLAESLAKEKALLCIGLSYYTFLPFIKAGIPLKPLPAPKEGLYASSGSGNLVIIKDAPHPNASKVFINWLLSREGQEIFGRAMGQATRRLDVDTTWTKEIGHIAAKEVITPERFFELENQSEEKINAVRVPAAAFAHRLLN